MRRQHLSREDRASLRDAIGTEPHILAWAAGVDGVVVATGEWLAHLNAGWRAWPWEQVLSGGWRPDPGVLYWRTIDGGGECRFEAPGDLPAVFRERVLASTLLSATMDLDGGSLTLTARRKPGGSGLATWLASASGRVNLEDPETAARVVAWTDDLRAEYGF